jgi:peptide chain release factor 1
MYQRYCDRQSGWSFSITEFVDGSAGGYSKIVANVTGEDVYGKLKYESGVHRVQRVPATESQGRVHTSAASVAVLPEAEELDFELDMKDVRKDTFRASGAGGQHVNKTESAIRLTHIPTGVVVECQDGRSQHANFDKALTVLRSRLYEAELRKQQNEVSEARRALVGSGDRSDKIRTYNFPQSRVTDHRINKTMYNLDAMMAGDIEDFIEALRIEDNLMKMNEAADNN